MKINRIQIDRSARMASVPADVAHEFTFTSPRSNNYHHQANVKRVSTTYPVDEIDWSITHTKAGGTVSFSLGWAGICPGVMKDLEVTQVIECTGQYHAKQGGAANLNHKASSTSQVNYLAKEGKVSLMLDHSGTTDQMNAGFESTATYTYTVSFARLPKATQEIGKNSDAAKSAKIYLSKSLLPYSGTSIFLTTDHIDTIDRQHANDVRFVFPSEGGEELEIWANTRTLVHASPYFKALLTSEFVEGQLRSKLEHDAARDNNGKRVDGMEDDLDDSDDEMDLEIIGNRNFDPATTPPCSCTYREVMVRSTAYTTYKAVLGYLHSSFISFTPLSSSSSSTSSDHGTSCDLVHTDDNTESTRLPSASPKSVYRLAHLLELPKLAQLALDNIKSQLRPANVALELFGNLAGVYDDLRKVELDYFVANYAAVKQTKTMDIVKQRAIAGELIYHSSTSMEVMERL
jgi:hypothetical protein